MGRRGRKGEEMMGRIGRKGEELMLRSGRKGEELDRFRLFRRCEEYLIEMDRCGND